MSPLETYTETGRDTLRLDPKTMVDTLNRMLIGWDNYFYLGAVSKAYSAVDLHVRQRLYLRGPPLPSA